MRTLMLPIALCLAALPGMAQTPTQVCNGDTVVVRVSTIKPGKLDAFMAAVAAHKAWYRENGVSDNEIQTLRILVRDEATKGWKMSDAEVMSVHIRPPAAGRTPNRGDAAWKAYVEKYRESSDIKSEYMACMPKHGQ